MTAEDFDTIRDPEALARLFHETYEALAPAFDYETRTESAVPWEDVPERNRALMIAVAGVIVDRLAGCVILTPAEAGAVKRYLIRDGFSTETKAEIVALLDARLGAAVEETK